MKGKSIMKRLISSLLILAFVLTIVPDAVPQRVSAAVSSKALASTYFNAAEKYLHLGDDELGTFNFDINKDVKKPGTRYFWYVKEDKGNPAAVTINEKNGIVTAKEAGTAYIRCKITFADGSYVRPEAKVTVRNNITEVGISNLPEAMTITAGVKTDFNRTVLNTEGGKGRKTEGITRWEIAEDTAGVEPVSDNGVVVPAGEGSFKIRAVSFQSNAKYKLWQKNKEANERYITAASDWYTILVKASDGTIVVGTQEQLEEALKAANIKVITLATEKADKFIIQKGDYSTKSLVVDAPKADVENHGSFKDITIKAIKDTTWIEYADGNIVYLQDDQLSFVVESTASIKQIVVDTPNSVVNFEIRGQVHKINVLQPSRIKLSGNSKNIPVTVEKEAKGSKISSSVPMDLILNADTELMLDKGAEKSSIDKSASSVEVKVENKSKEPVVITTNKTGEETIKSGETGTSNEATAPATTPAPVPFPGGGGGGVTLPPSEVRVTGVSLSLETMTLEEGGEPGVLSATVSPSNADNKNIEWSTSDSSVAAVASGVVTPVSAGTATITVTTADGQKTDRCLVTVNEAEAEPEPEQPEMISAEVRSVGNYRIMTVNSEKYIFSEYELLAGGSKILLDSAEITAIEPKASSDPRVEATVIEGSDTLWINNLIADGSFTFTLTVTDGTVYEFTVECTKAVTVPAVKDGVPVWVGGVDEFVQRYLLEISPEYHESMVYDLTPGHEFYMTRLIMDPVSGKPCIELPTSDPEIPSGTYTYFIRTDDKWYTTTFIHELTDEPIDPVPGNAIFRPTGNFNFITVDGASLMFLEYELLTEGRRIDLSNINSFLPEYNSEDSIVTMTMGSTLWINYSRESGTYPYTIVDRNEVTYEAVLEWTAPTRVEAVKNGEPVWRGYMRTELFQDYAIAFDQVTESMPLYHLVNGDHGQTSHAFGPDSYFNFFLGSYEGITPAGDNVYLFKAGDTWYQFNISNEGVDESVNFPTPEENLGVLKAEYVNEITLLAENKRSYISKSSYENDFWPYVSERIDRISAADSDSNLIAEYETTVNYINNYAADVTEPLFTDVIYPEELEGYDDGSYSEYYSFTTDKGRYYLVDKANPSYVHNPTFAPFTAVEDEVNGTRLEMDILAWNNVDGFKGITQVTRYPYEDPSSPTVLTEGVDYAFLNDGGREYIVIYNQALLVGQYTFHFRTEVPYLGLITGNNVSIEISESME